VLERFSALFLIPALLMAAAPDPQIVIQKSVEANQRDFKAAPLYNYKERDKTPTGTKTFQVSMLEGSPYQRLIAVNGKSLTAQQAADEMKKQQAALAVRKAESAEQRKSRIDKYERDRQRDQVMMSQLTAAFNFKIAGQQRISKFTTWALKATPKPGYKPPNMDCQVLPGMQGELWIDQKTNQWVKVTARVIRPVSIEGFLAQVEPGTEFEIEKTPVSSGIWEITHYSSHAQAKVLGLFNHNQQDDVTFYDFQPVSREPVQ
jgi:hypothetical protein